MRILIGYTGTPAADAALRDLENAGLPATAQACILVGIPLVPPREALASDPVGTAWFPTGATLGVEKGRVDAAMAVGSKAADWLKARWPGWEIRVEARFEPPAYALLDFEETWKPDLIAVGSHGWSWLGRTFLGSTAEKVLAHAKANVRLCHPRQDRAPGPPRILAAVDGSLDSRQAVLEIGKRNWPAGTRIRLVAAREYAWADAMAEADMLSTGGKPSDAPRWSWMEDYLDATVAKLRSQGLDASAAILDGEPRHVLLTEAEAFRADCICMGRRGLSGFKRLLMGSVSGAVASHAPCSVEVIRETAEG